MNETTVKHGLPQALSTRVTRPIALLVSLLVLLVALAGGTWVYRTWTAPPPATAQAVERAMATTISVKTLEERYGIRLNLLGVTALGGMVDFRYLIMDTAKAKPLVEYLSQIKLIAEDNGTTLTMATGHGMHRNDRIQKGQLNFHFFANEHNAIKAGRPVTVVIGPVRLEAINAQ